MAAASEIEFAAQPMPAGHHLQLLHVCSIIETSKHH